MRVTVKKSESKAGRTRYHETPKKKGVRTKIISESLEVEVVVVVVVMMAVVVVVTSKYTTHSILPYIIISSPSIKILHMEP